MRSRGFTLIELLVVIAIIGMLSSIVLASLNTAREKAANARRLSDLKQIQTALELYYAANGSYPNVSGAECLNGSIDTVSWANVRAVLASYIALPGDPARDCPAWRYYFVVSSLTDYKVGAHNPPSPTSVSSSVWDPRRDGGPDYTLIDGTGPWGWSLQTPGGVTW